MRRLPLPAKLLLAPCIAILAVELMVRCFYWIAGDPYSASATLEDIERRTEGMTKATPGLLREDGGLAPSDVRIVHPFYGWEVGPRGIEEDLAHFQSGAAEATYDILVLGSSIGAAFADRGAAPFVARLRADPRFAEREVRFLTYARGAFKEPQQLMVLCWLLSLGIEPDAVISIDGFNEVALGGANQRQGAHPAYPAMAQWAPVVGGGFLDGQAVDLLLDLRREQRAALELADFAARWRLTWSCVLGRTTQRRLARIQEDWQAARKRYLDHVVRHDVRAAVRGPRFGEGREAAVRTAVDVWERATRTLQAICDERSIVFLQVLQPNLVDPGSKPLSDEERAIAVDPGWIECARLGYPLLRGAGLRLLDHGVNHLDASDVFDGVEATIYYDAGHFVPRGHELLAERVAEGFLHVASRP